MRFMHFAAIVAILTIFGSMTLGQIVPAGPVTPVTAPPVTVTAVTATPVTTGVPPLPDRPVLTGLPDYIMGPGDTVVINAINLDEISAKPTRITAAGDLNLPIIGQVHAAGLTTVELQEQLVERVRGYVREPQLSVNVTDFKSHPVSVLGAIRNPGLLQLDGNRTLIEVLSTAGGLRDDASYKIKITRRTEWGAIPLPGATTEMQGTHSVAEVDYLAIVDASRPQDNIQILPYDIISVAKAKLVYVVGAMNRPGGYVLNEKEEISLLELIARADGWTPSARYGEAKILRPIPGSTHDEIAVNLKKLLDRKITNMTLHADDILVVPDSYAKGQIKPTIGGIFQSLIGMAVYRGIY